MPGGYKNIKPEDGKKTQFKKGQSGNPAGGPTKLPNLDVLLAEVLGEEKEGKTAAQAILMALRAKASKGDIRAAEVLLNRGWGLPTQRIDSRFIDKDGKDRPLIVLKDDPNCEPLPHDGD